MLAINRHTLSRFVHKRGLDAGWVGERIKLQYTRAMVQAALNGDLRTVETTVDPIFGLHIPLHCPGVPDHVLQPRETWADKDAYDKKARELAENFKENFKKFTGVSERIKNAGPK